MKAPLAILIFLVEAVSLSRGAQWYVSTNGTGIGTFASPWNLQAALTNSAINAGDTVWLRGGVYVPTATNVASGGAVQWWVNLTGAVNNLITFRPYTNEAAKIDREWYLNDSGFLRFRDLEFYDSMKGHNPTNNSYPSGPWVHFSCEGDGPGGNEWINCVIHDVDNVWEKNASGASVRGCIIWHAGLNHLEHVCYPSPQTFSGNIVAWHVNDVIEHPGYNNFLMQSNVIFGGGQTTTDESRDVLLDDPTKSWTVAYNYLYNYYPNGPRYSMFYPQMFSYSQGSICVMNSNVMASPNPIVFADVAFSSVSILGNTIHMNALDGGNALERVGHQGLWTVNNNHYTAQSPASVVFYDNNTSLTFAQWKSTYPGLDTASTATNSVFPPDQIYVIPNQDQAKRAHIAVYNFTHAGNVTVNLSGVLSSGDAYQLYSAQNYNAGAIRSGTFNGTSISIPMTNLTAAHILYGTNWGLTDPPPTSPEFGAFVLIGSPGFANAAPTISTLPNTTVAENTATPPLVFTVSDVETAASNLTVTGVSSNLTLVPNTNIVFGGSGSNRTVTVTPALNQSGTATITLTVSDGTAATSTNFVLTVTPVNDPPTISGIPNTAVAEDTPTAPLPFTVSDVETAASSLTVTGNSSNPTLVPTNNIVFGGSGSNRNVTVTPAASQNGSTTITLTVSDGTAATSTNFVLTVTVVNNPPSISGVPDTTVAENTATLPLAFTVSDVETAASNLTVTGVSSNLTLVPNSDIVFGGSGSNRTVTVTPAANQSGTATVTLTVSDGTASASTNFILAVTAVNNPPSISGVPNTTVAENTATPPLAFTVSDVETPASNLTVTGVSSNLTLVPNSNIVFGGSGSNRTVTVTPATNQIGTATVTLTVSDGNTSTSTNFVLAVGQGGRPAVKVYVPMEAEAGTLTAPVQKGSDSSASGGQFVSSDTADQGTDQLSFVLGASDDYVVWCRVLSPDSSHDSFYVAVDNGPEDIYDTAEGTWTNVWQWSMVNGRAGGAPLTVNPRVFSLSAGSHFITFRAREAGTGLDQILVTNDRNFVPEEIFSPQPPQLAMNLPGQLWIANAANTTCQIWTTTNLAAPVWELRDTVSLNTSPQLWVDTQDITAPQRYYRVVILTGVFIPPAPQLLMNLPGELWIVNAAHTVCQVWVSTALAPPTWTLRETLTVTNSPQLWVDTNAALLPESYYRVVVTR